MYVFSSSVDSCSSRRLISASASPVDTQRVETNSRNVSFLAEIDDDRMDTKEILFVEQAEISRSSKKRTSISFSASITQIVRLAMMIKAKCSDWSSRDVQLFPVRLLLVLSRSISTFLIKEPSSLSEVVRELLDRWVVQFVVLVISLRWAKSRIVSWIEEGWWRHVVVLGFACHHYTHSDQSRTNAMSEWEGFDDGTIVPFLVIYNLDLAIWLWIWTFQSRQGFFSQSIFYN